LRANDARTVDYPRKEAPGTILVDTEARYLYYVLPQDKAIRYGVAVGEEALAFSGVARVGRMTEWPDWIPTPEIQARLGPYPARVAGGPSNPLGARALYLFDGNKDTLYRIHGTNQPEYIGQAISSGCIRMTNASISLIGCSQAPWSSSSRRVGMHRSGRPRLGAADHRSGAARETQNCVRRYVERDLRFSGLKGAAAAPRNEFLRLRVGGTAGRAT